MTSVQVSLGVVMDDGRTFPIISGILETVGTSKKKTPPSEVENIRTFPVFDFLWPPSLFLLPTLLSSSFPYTGGFSLLGWTNSADSHHSKDWDSLAFRPPDVHNQAH